MEEKMHILIAEDDKDIVEVLRLYLTNEGFDVVAAYNGKDAMDIIDSRKIDLCIFDIMMPVMNGYELIKKTREKYTMPIIVLSAKNADSDKILGLNIGADDYVTKPFNPLEVVARVNSSLRRKNEFTSEKKDKDILKVGDLYLDKKMIKLTKGDVDIPITPMEFKILSILMESPGRVYTKVQIYEIINGEYFESDENTLMVHMSKLREKIEDDPKKPMYIKTIRGLGYKMEAL